VPGTKVSGGTWGSPVTLCHRHVGQERGRRCPPRDPTLPRLRAAALPLRLGGTQRPRCGRGGGAGARREELGRENVLVQWTKPCCSPGAGGFEKACGAQEADGLCREPRGTEQQLPQPLLPAPPSPPDQPLQLPISLPGCPTPKTPLHRGLSCPTAGSPRPRCAAWEWDPSLLLGPGSGASLGFQHAAQPHVNRGPHAHGARALGRWVPQG